MKKQCREFFRKHLWLTRFVEMETVRKPAVSAERCCTCTYYTRCVHVYKRAFQ